MWQGSNIIINQGNSLLTEGSLILLYKFLMPSKAGWRPWKAVYLYLLMISFTTSLFTACGHLCIYNLRAVISTSCRYRSDSCGETLRRKKFALSRIGQPTVPWSGLLGGCSPSVPCVWRAGGSRATNFTHWQINQNNYIEVAHDSC